MLDVKLIYRLLDRAGIVILVNFAISLHVAKGSWVNIPELGRGYCTAT